MRREKQHTKHKKGSFEMNITAKIANTDGEKIRLKVDRPIVNDYGRQVSDKCWATGISLEAVYIGRKWFVVEFASIWDRGNGRCVGTYYVAYEIGSSDDSEILNICDRLGIDPPKRIEAEEA